MNLIRSALAYAELGIPVFPVYGVNADRTCGCGDPHDGGRGLKAREIGKHPITSNGSRAATTDVSRIQAWWTKHPTANIATVPAKAQRPMVVLDLDTRNGSDATRAHLEALHGKFGSAVVTRTGGGGEHLYFWAPPGASFAGKAGPGIDIQYAGYVILPPSKHRSGLAYEFVDGYSLLEEDAREFMCEVPDWLLRRDAIGQHAALASDDARMMFETVEHETPERVQFVTSLLRALDPDGSRDQYMTVQRSIHALGWSNGLERFARPWARGDLHGIEATKYDDDTFDRDVRDLSHSKDRPPVTLGSLIRLAEKEAGWIDPRKVAGARDTFGDISNGKRFAAKYRGTFLYVYGAGKWLRWDGMRWTWCNTGDHLRAAQVVASEALDAAHAAVRADSTDANRSNYNQALSVHRNSRRLEGLLAIAAGEEGMGVPSPALLDVDPWLLGVRNGVVNLRTGSLLDPDPRQLITRQAAACVSPAQQCPRWLAFLNDVFQDQEAIAFMQRVCGYSLTGSVDEEKLFFMFGGGANGKSVFANILQGIFDEYAVTVRATMLARNVRGNDGEAEREKTRLPGARLVLINEVSSNDVFDDQHVKELVSRERVSARALYSESFEFTPTHKIFIRGNHQPGALDSSDGFWRRVVLVPFLRVFADRERVADLDRTILSLERDGILAWMIDGCLAWQRDGLRIPASIRSASEQYRRDTDVLGDWMDSRCERKAGVRERVGSLFASYCTFLREANVKAPSLSAFSRQLRDRGFGAARDSRSRYVVGLLLLAGTSFEVEVDDDSI